MTAAEIREAVEARGTTLPALSRARGFRSNALSTSLVADHRQPKAHRAIAGFLGLPLHQLWPQHYGPEGYRNRTRERRFTDEDFEPILRRVAAGERPKDVCAEPGMPSLTAVFKHRKRSGRFATRWAVAVQRGVLKPPPVTDDRIEAVLARVELGENLVDVCAEPGMPSSASVFVHRRRNPHEEHRWIEALGKRPGAKVERDPGRLATYLKAVEAGQETRQLGKLIDWKSVRRIRDADPFFARRLTEARQAGRIIVARATTSRSLTSTEVWAIVESAVRYVPHEARDDIRGDLALALYEGRVAPDGARAATRELMTAWNRQFARWDVSMDSEVGEPGEGLTFGAMISDGSFDAAAIGVRVRSAEW